MSAEKGLVWQEKKLPVVVTILVVLGWISSMLFVPVLSRHYYGLNSCAGINDSGEKINEDNIGSCKESEMTASGLFGDSFGAINALFSGLALAGVVLTLYLHAEGARRTAKPFVVPRMLRFGGSSRVSISEPTRKNAVIRLPLSVVVPVKNSSQHPALNVIVSILIDGVCGRVDTVAELPLASGDETECVLRIDVDGEEAMDFGRKVSGDGASMNIRCEYQSVEGVRWYSEVRYVIRVNSHRNDDRTLLDAALDGRMADAGQWTAETTIDLDYLVVKDSWGYGEVS